MSDIPTPKIIQLLMSPNNSVWQGVILGLGDDGATYHCQGDTWQPCIPPLNLQDKATELTAVTEQRDTARYYAETFRQNIHDIKPDNLLPLYLPWDSEPEINEYQSVIEQRDRLSEALRVINTYDPKNGQCDDGYTPVFHARKALAAVKGGADA